MQIRMKEPQPKQTQALLTLSKYPVLFYGGAKGGGKSWLIRYWMVLRRLKYPETNGVIIRKTYAELDANHIKKMWVEYPELMKAGFNSSKKELKFHNGSVLTFRHLANSTDVYNFQGAEYEDIALDECTQHTEEAFTTLRSSNRTVVKGISPRFLLTGNPGGIGHMWVKRLFIDKDYSELEDPAEYGFVQAKVHDNPILVENDPGYVKKLEALPEDKRRAYLDGDWDVFEGQFFTEWRKEKHVIEPRYKLKEMPTNFTYRIGWDEGNRAPRAVYILAQDNDGRVEVIWEYYRAGETVNKAALNIKTAWEVLGILDTLQERARIVFDPSMKIKSNQTGISTAKVVSDILGVPMEPGNNDRLDGARRFKDMLQHDKLTPPLMTVWSTCHNLIRTLPQLIYSDNGSEDVDTTVEDHAYDAVRYGLMSFRRAPERMRGDKPTGMKSYQKRKSIWDR